MFINPFLQCPFRFSYIHSLFAFFLIYNFWSLQFASEITVKYRFLRMSWIASLFIILQSSHLHFTSSCTRLIKAFAFLCTNVSYRFLLRLNANNGGCEKAFCRRSDRCKVFWCFLGILRTSGRIFEYAKTIGTLSDFSFLCLLSKRIVSVHLVHFFSCCSINLPLYPRSRRFCFNSHPCFFVIGFAYPSYPYTKTIRHGPFDIRGGGGGLVFFFRKKIPWSDFG